MASNSRHTPHDLERAILSTLAYHNVFQFPLTLGELSRYLISRTFVDEFELEQTLKALQKNGTVGEFKRLYFLREFRSFVATRREKHAWVGKMDVATRAAELFRIIPWIKLVGITGALAMGNTDENDDIDLMIVTSRNRLWITRLVATLLTTFFFKRRKPITQSTCSTISYFSDALCLNLWLDEDAVAIARNQRSLYVAHELAQIKPLVNKDQTYERMMRENEWGRKFLANAWKGFQVSSIKYQVSRENRILNFLNQICYKLQHWYMKSKMTTERVSLHAAFFHPGNRSRDILCRYRHLLDKYKIDI